MYVYEISAQLSLVLVLVPAGGQGSELRWETGM